MLARQLLSSPARPGISHLAYMSHGHWPQETNQDPRKKKNHAAPGQPLTRVLCFTEVSSCVCWRITTILVILTVPSFKAPHYTIICRYAAIQLASAAILLPRTFCSGSGSFACNFMSHAHTVRTRLRLLAFAFWLFFALFAAITLDRTTLFAFHGVDGVLSPPINLLALLCCLTCCPDVWVFGTPRKILL